MRSTNWPQSSLGPTGGWPQSLRAALSICIGARFPIAIYWGRELALLYNDAWSPILGSKHPWALGRPAREVWPEIWDTIGPLFEQVATTGEAVYQEDSLLPMHRHGYTEECYFNFTFSPIRGESGKLEGIFNAVIETTFRVIAERRTRVLRDLGEHLATANSAQQACELAVESLESAAHDAPFCAVYLIDKQTHEAQRAACSPALSLAGAAPDRVSLSNEQKPWPLVQAYQTEKMQIVTDLNVRVAMPLSARAWPEPVISALVSPLKSSSTGGIAGFLILGASPRRAIDEEYRQFAEHAASHVAHIISRTTEFEVERKRAEALAEIDRAKTAFFSNVSHEFRTPLTLMLGPTEEALASPDRSLRGIELERVHRNQQRLLKLVNTLLDFSRLEAGRAEGRFEPVDLSAFTADLASAFRSLVEKAGLTLNVEAPPLPVPVYVDRAMFEKVLLNLISNAFKFTFSGGICVSVDMSKTHARVRVADTGTGIPENEVPHVFQRFHRVEGARGRSYEGSGIGLALVQELVKLHGGSVTLESRFGEGSTFTVLLPLGKAHLPPERIQASNGQAPLADVTPYLDEATQWIDGEPQHVNTRLEGLGGASAAVPGSILLADDNRDMREYVRQLLTAQGWNVTSVSNGEEALAHAVLQTPDLVLTDVMMPKLDGYGLLKALRGNPTTRLVPVILLSARAGKEAQVEGLNAGADDYLVKPFVASELLARVRAQLNTAHSRQEAARVAEAARAVAESERARMHGLLSQIPATVNFFRGPDLVLEFSPPTALRRLGRDVLGKPLLDALPEHRNQPYAEMLKRVFHTGEPIVGSEALVKTLNPRTGDFDDSYWNFTYLPIRNAGGIIEGVMTFDVEVTDQVLARRKAEALMDELKLADQRKDEFLAMLAHELRNPMAAISVALSLMERVERDPVKSAKHRETAQRQLNNLVRLVDDLLDVSRITRGKVELRTEEVDLATIIQHALTAARPAIEEGGHELSVTLAPGLFRVDADATRLEQVFVNLLTNASKYTAPGGLISVRLSKEPTAPDTWAILSVRDNGRGIPSEMLTQVFDMFVQVSPTLDRGTGGLGLGLTLVKRLVEMHGGEVVARSDGLGKGSEFMVRLPLSGEHHSSLADRGSEGAAVAPSTTSKRRRILVVEDSEDVRETLKDLLEELGHDVFVAADGLEGADKVLALRPDVALVDVGLPGIDGYELARRVRGSPEGDKLYLVALTGYGGAEAKAQAEAAGFDLHLTKPVNVRELPSVVNRNRTLASQSSTRGGPPLRKRRA